jgi:hypothetical protein
MIIKQKINALKMGFWEGFFGVGQVPKGSITRYMLYKASDTLEKVSAEVHGDYLDLAQTYSNEVASQAMDIYLRRAYLSLVSQLEQEAKKLCLPKRIFSFFASLVLWSLCVLSVYLMMSSLPPPNFDQGSNMNRLFLQGKWADYAKLYQENWHIQNSRIPPHFWAYLVLSVNSLTAWLGTLSYSTSGTWNIWAKDTQKVQDEPEVSQASLPTTEVHEPTNVTTPTTKSTKTETSRKKRFSNWLVEQCAMLVVFTPFALGIMYSCSWFTKDSILYTLGFVSNILNGLVLIGIPWQLVLFTLGLLYFYRVVRSRIITVARIFLTGIEKEIEGQFDANGKPYENIDPRLFHILASQVLLGYHHVHANGILDLAYILQNRFELRQTETERQLYIHQEFEATWKNCLIHTRLFGLFKIEKSREMQILQGLDPIAPNDTPSLWDIAVMLADQRESRLEVVKN